MTGYRFPSRSPVGSLFRRSQGGTLRRCEWRCSATWDCLGCVVEEAEPDYRDGNECFLAWRHWMIESRFGDLIASKGDQVNEYIHWHVDEGRKLTGPHLSRMELKRSALYERVRGFFQKYDFFVLPVNQVLPFDVTQHYPATIDGTKMDNYLSWMKSACYITTTGNPAASVPCAFSKGRTANWDTNRRTTSRRLGCVANGLYV
jgi:Asp-tRNA(Asn)/Glu-tRNA(Gln) amidotransferase A subunit family amidase